MLIEVVSTVDDKKGLVDASFLDLLIKNGTLKAFKRKGRWVVVGQRDVRRAASNYNGPERRIINQISE